MGSFLRPEGEERPDNMPPPILWLRERTRFIPLDREERTGAFLEQASHLADYEDGSRLTGLTPHPRYIGYWDFSAAQLRQYFSWRTRFRRGEKVDRVVPYIRLCAAELINLIGARDPEEAFDGLLKLQAVGMYSGVSPLRMPVPLLDKWIADFAVAYGLEQETAQAYCISHPETEEERLILECCHEADDHALCRAVSLLLDDPVSKSRFLREVPEDAEHVIARACRGWAEGFPGGDGPSLAEELFGKREKKQTELFYTCPFRCRLEDGYRYEVHPALAYEYRDGMWVRDGRFGICRKEDLAHLRAVVRECERLLRKVLGGHALPRKLDEPVRTRQIERIIQEWLEEKSRKSRPEVKVDLSRLSAIRSDAAVTRDQLLEGTEEAETEPDLPLPDGWTEGWSDGWTIADPAGPAGPDPDAGSVPAKEGAGSVFTQTESEFLRSLLDGAPWQDIVKRTHLPVSVLADGINEKAWEEIGDSVIDLEGDTPVLVEDYREDLLQIL